MAKPSSPRRAVRKAPQPREHRYIGALVADDFGGMRTLTSATANSFSKKKLDAASQSLQLRAEQQAKKAGGMEARDTASAERNLQAELRESDRRISLFWRRMLTKVRPEKSVRHKPPKARARLWPYASVALPKYDSPVIDRRGERGVFVRMRYYSRRTAKAGVSQRVLLYCYNGAALDADGVPYAHSNIGETIDEALCGLDHLEQINWSAQKNAKLLMHGIFAVDHRQSRDQMMQVGTRWAEETLGRFDLPYLVTLHAPPEDGDARNWHLHILWSFRPMVRTGDHEWQIAEMLRTDLDNPAAMKVFRELYAAVMTNMSIEAGQNQVYTAKSNADRGLVHESQVHLNAVRTNRARQGEFVPANEDNHERVMRSKAAVLDEKLRHVDDALAKQQKIDRAITARWARLPALPSRVPKRTIAATLSAILPDVAAPVARSSSPVFHAIVLPARLAAVRPIAPIPHLTHTALSRVANAHRTFRCDDMAAFPDLPMRAASMEIANLRLSPAPRSNRRIGTEPLVPGVSPAVRYTVALSALTSVACKRVDMPVQSIPASQLRQTSAIMSPIASLNFRAMPRTTSTSSVPAALTRAATVSRVGPFRAVTPPPPFANIGSVVNAIARVRAALRRDDERREREADAERAKALAVERIVVDEHHRQALAGLFTAITEERHYLPKENGVPVVDPELLARFDLAPTDVAGADARKRIAYIADQQSIELLKIRDYVDRSPHHIVRNGEGWTFDDRAPADIRDLAEAWRNDATLQRALGYVVAAVPVEAPPRIPVQPRTDAPGTAWQRARIVREQAMAETDVAERLDDPGLMRPGRHIARPGTDRTGTTLPIARRFLGLPDSGIGG